MAPWVLSSGDGTKTVYAQFEDYAGNVTTASASIILDTTAPTASISIDNGAIGCNTTSVTLTLSASDATSGVYQMRFSNDDSTWSSWVAYSTSSSWTLSTGTGTKTVYAQFSDNVGNVSTVSASIIYDTTAPTAGTCTPPASVNTSTITVPYTGASDAGSGLAKVELWYRYSSTGPGTSGTWTDSGLHQTGASGSFTFTPSSDGWYYFTLVATDNAGNSSSAASGTGTGPTISQELFYDGFESNTFTANNWVLSPTSGTGKPAIQTTYKNSGTYAAELYAGGSIVEKFSTAGYTGIIVSVRAGATHFDYQYLLFLRPVPPLTAAGPWTTLESNVTSTSNSFTVKTISLPTGSGSADNNANFQIRFGVGGSASSSHVCYLDDVYIIGL